MKKLGVFSLILLFLALFSLNEIVPIFGPNIKIQESSQKFSNETSGNLIKREIRKDEIYQGNLLLVNRNYPARQESIKTDVVNLFIHNELVNGYGIFDSAIYLSEEIAEKFSNMMIEAEKDGLKHFMITSGFRSFEEQERLYQEMGSDYALPAGYSEHNLGLSLDVGSTQMKMENAPEGKWIEDNAWKYGFILRYPKDKTHITGIQYEPWHIRYVGLPHSAIMKEKNLALEEYLDYLREVEKLTVNLQGKKYVVSYYDLNNHEFIEVPKGGQYEISGNNVDGVIVTVYE